MPIFIELRPDSSERRETWLRDAEKKLPVIDLINVSLEFQKSYAAHQAALICTLNGLSEDFLAVAQATNEGRTDDAIDLLRCLISRTSEVAELINRMRDQAKQAAEKSAEAARRLLSLIEENKP